MADKYERNFEEYLEEEQQAGPAEEQTGEVGLYDDEDSEHENLMKLLAYLEDELTRARVVPMTNKRMINAEMCIDIISDIRANLPKAVQYAEQILAERDRITRAAEQTAANKMTGADVRARALTEDAQSRADRILADAQAHADNIVKDAEIRARAMIDQNTITLEAQKKAEEILSEARQEAQERRYQAASYCDNLLHDAEETLQAAFDDIRRNRTALAQSRAEMRQ